LLAVCVVFEHGHAQTPAKTEARRTPSVEDYRRAAMTREGDVANGAKLFKDEERLGCSKCHSIDGSASKAGPDLFAAGDAFARRDLVNSILTPSATISPGYGTVTIETKSGETYQGVLKQSTDTALQLMGGDGKRIDIAKADIQRQEGSAVSLMPEGLQNALSQQEFTDLIEYLTTLKQPENTLLGERGMPARIPELATPVGLIPFLSKPLTVTNSKVQTGLTALAQVPGAPDEFLVLHQKGIIWKVKKAASGDEDSIFSDLTGGVFYERGPNGLLGIAFHPKFRENRRYYLQHQVWEDGTVATLVVEKEFSADFRSDSGKPARRIIKINSVAEDHSGGWLEFGPDGFLYFAMGDTGPHHDPNGHAQNLRLLLGKMLRIDVDHQDAGLAYAIPADNPFVGQADARPEIWAYGLRNPWRFSFDSATGDLWMADVGQDRAEEISIIRRGENHGWNVYEGFEPFSNQYRVAGRTFTPPIFVYRRRYGNSVTGGYVYRAEKRSSFYGAYVCGDFTSKRIFALTQEKGSLKAVRQIATLPQQLVSFGIDEAGTIYAVGYEGMVYRMDFDTSRFDDVKEPQPK
jgi:putative heme-binding domain-containing protein